MPTNLEYRERERQRKRESRRQVSDAKRRKERQRARARDKKSGDEKIRNASGHQGEYERQWKKKQTNKKQKTQQHNMYDISSIKRVARNVLEFSLPIVVVQNNGKEMYKKSVLRLQKLLFC